MNTSEKIKSLREQKRIKQIEIANQLNLDPAYYARLEKRGDKLTVEQLKQIADALGASVADLLEINVPESNDDTSDKIVELEKWLSDKELVIESKNNQIKNIERHLEDLISSRLFHFAKGKNVLSILFYKSKIAQNHEKVVGLKEFDKMIGFDDDKLSSWSKEYPYYSYHISHEKKQEFLELFFHYDAEDLQTFIWELVECLLFVRNKEGINADVFFEVIDEILNKLNVRPIKESKFYPI